MYMNRRNIVQAASRQRRGRFFSSAGVAACLAALCLLNALPAAGAVPSATGGPDEFGYRYTDSTTGFVPYNFVDIESDGRLSSVSSMSQGFEVVDIGFEFQFYDNSYTFCYLNADGYVNFLEGTNSFAINEIPNAAAPNNFIAPFFADLNPAAVGWIYSKTIGSAPNRIFIVQYERVRFAASGVYLPTFQIQLFEGSNKIEMHYEAVRVFTNQDILIGIENEDGTQGLQYYQGNGLSAETDISSVSQSGAIRFERPVIVTVESSFGQTRVTPNVGSRTAAYNAEQTFDAPPFIYLNRDFEELDSIGDLNDPDDLNIAYYRARNVGYAIDGETIQGTERFFKTTLEKDIKVIWQWELDYAVFVESPNNDSGFGAPDPAIGRTWRTRDEEFFATIDTVAGDGDQGLRARTTGYQLSNVRGAPVAVTNDNFWKFTETVSPFTLSGFPELTQFDDYTFSFWGKIDGESDSGRDQVFLNVFMAGPPTWGNHGYAGYPLWDESMNAGLRVGVRADGRFFVEDVYPWLKDDIASQGYGEGYARTLAEVPAALVGHEWHHWAIVLTYVSGVGSGVRLYRDGQLVAEPPNRYMVFLRRFEQPINAIRVGSSAYRKTGSSTTQYDKLIGSVNNVSVINRALSAAEIRAYARTDGVAHADSEFLHSSNIQDSTEFHKPELVPFLGSYRTALRENRDVLFSPTGDRAATEIITIDDWLRVRWLWEGEARYRFDASAADGAASLRQLNGEPFVRVYDTNGVNPETYFGPTTNAVGAGPNIDVWIPVGRKADVGCFYRTAKRDLTLSGPTPQQRDGFMANPVGDLPSTLTLSSLVDVDVLDSEQQTRVARIHSVPSVGGPSEIHWLFRPTVFRAELPLGQGLDAVNPNATLVPALPGTVAELRTGNEGPGGPFIGPTPDLEDPGVPNGEPAVWDRVGKLLFPVQPGNYTVDWPDANLADTTYTIELVSGFPGDTNLLSSFREDPEGRRLTTTEFVSEKVTPRALDGLRNAVTNGAGVALNYIKTATLAPVSDAFPGFPSAHYRHLFDTESERRPPTKLDGDSEDRWLFRQQTYMESNVGAVIDPSNGQNFEAQGPGRTALLYSFRPDSTEIATGDPAEERLAVRVVRSEPMLPVDPLTTPLGQYVLRPGSSGLGLVRSGAYPTTLAPGKDFSIDFWVDFGSVSANVMLVDTGILGLKVAVDPVAQTLTANYYNINVTRPLPETEANWRHIIVQVFESLVGGFSPRISLVLSVDGVSEENAMPRASAGTPPAAAIAPIETTVQATGLRFGVGGIGGDGLRLDRLRLYKYPATNVSSMARLSFAAREYLRTGQGPAPALPPLLQFDFSTAPVDLMFANSGSVSGVGLGAVSGDPRERVNLQEVATRIRSVLDRIGFGSGYVVNDLSNYNVDLYQRTADVGAWGPLYPINNSLLFSGPREFQVAYYENPYLDYPDSNEYLHPNVAWPYVVAGYSNVVYPTEGPHKDKRITIASRIGSEGVDANGLLQERFSTDRVANLAIYHQPDREAAGFNPNEEHALVAGTYRASLKVKELGEDSGESAPLAIFALQNQINNLIANPSLYTSDPWVLVQFESLASGKSEMAAYRVDAERAGSVPFPRPLDGELTIGMAYEDADTLDERFLSLDPEQAFDFSYTFEYPAYAGDLLLPPYPLGLVIGNTTMFDARGGNLRVSGADRRSFWKDVNGNPWIVSGDGRFFYQYFYPYRSDFYLPGAEVGTPVAWLASNPQKRFFGGSADVLQPVPVTYNTAWRSDYPKLKRGETLTYQGGEYFNETPGANGLPALVAMAAAEVVFDSGTPSMINANELKEAYSARVIRPLDRFERAYSSAGMAAIGFSPAATTKIFVVAERWYFKDLPGSLQRRFYYNSLSETIVFRGYLNDKDSGDADLTSGPDPINTLEPNVLTLDEYNQLVALAGSSSTWKNAMRALFVSTQNPHGLTGITVTDTSRAFYAGIKSTPTNHPAELMTYWASPTAQASTVPPTIVPLDSFGVGSALVPNPQLMTSSVNGSRYLTIAENNRTELDGAPVSLHIIEILPDRYRGAIKVIEGADAFSEKITLQHNGEFGANTDDLYYEWWIRDAGPLDTVEHEVLANGTLKTVDSSGKPLWEEYIPRSREGLSNSAKHAGLHSIVFEGSPKVTLSDKMVLMRYRHKTEGSWKLAPFTTTESPSVAWAPGSPAPFQWAGAANSPQLKADGSKRYVPQLVMGWVKRVLDRINPYEARYTDFFGNESPATYSSQIQIAGPPFSGAVALNPDKNVIENTGLIELYETVLQRAKALSIENSTDPSSSDGIGQALLLAATRLSVLYELLAREAYSDAQDSTLRLSSEFGQAGEAAYTHAFENQEADLLHEELALLRGTDFRKSAPVVNRMIWNYVKGLGEAAYNVNYNIYDVNTDGFINEDDARALYPQGHGDAWGHFLSAVEKAYALLRDSDFSWQSRSELYSLMQNVIEADYLDERTFARLAAGKARAGRDIVRNTYRVHYTQDPDGQWQGYEDGVDKARAWGVSEWAHRAGQGAYFDWAVANALLPVLSPTNTLENLDRIDRLSTQDEVAEIAGSLYEIELAMDQANGGVNPLGFDADALAFDIDPLVYDGDAQGRKTHFEQIYDRAVLAGNNARTTLDYATAAGNKLRDVATDTEGLIVQAFRQDLDFRNRLIEIFGRPYEGTIGFGEIYPEGYEGPDTLLFAYLDHTTISQIIPEDAKYAPSTTVNFTRLLATATGVADDSKMRGLYEDVYDLLGSGPSASKLAEAFVTLQDSRTYEDFTEFVREGQIPVRARSPYAYQSDAGWGKRTSYGKLQRILEEELRERIELDSAIKSYVGFLQDFEVAVTRLENEVYLADLRTRIDTAVGILDLELQAFKLVKDSIATTAQTLTGTIGDAADGGSEALPTSIGFSTDATAPARGGIKLAAVITRTAARTSEKVAKFAILVAEQLLKKLVSTLKNQAKYSEWLSDIEGQIVNLVSLSGNDGPLRAKIGIHLHNLEMLRQEYVTAQAEGYRVLREREAFNKVLASSVQKNRYADMALRLSRNEAMTKYQTTFDHAARYAWLATRAYDYETSLDPGDPAAAGPLLDAIVKERELGLWAAGEPQIGQGGLAESLAQLNANFQVLKGQLGINNPQAETEKISLRHELFRIAPAGNFESDRRWKEALLARKVDNLFAVPEFMRYCRPFADPDDGAQPGIVIRFSTSIEPGRNVFGNMLTGGDHAYSMANFATKIRGFGVWVENYNDTGLATTPRAYLVPVGDDYMRVSTATTPTTRIWNLQEQRIPTPFTINAGNLTLPGFIPSLDGIDGSFSELRRHGDFRIYHDSGATISDSELVYDSRLIGRSVWNSDWMLIIPGANLDVDAERGLETLAASASDIKLFFQTYSYQGQ